ncbi:MAG: hypothetical protein ABSG31_05810 [Tepidisphaeraceae bacterium]|jgi:hypothetical protein
MNAPATKTGITLELTPRSIIGVCGAIILALGTFTPIAYMPIAGNLCAFQQEVIGWAFLGSALAAAVLSMTRGKIVSLVLGCLLAVGIAADLWNVSQTLANAKDSVSTDLAGNPFAGLAQTMIDAAHLEWGWIILFLGAALIAVAPMISTISFKSK